MKIEVLSQSRVVILGFGREGQAAHRVLSKAMSAERLSVWAETGEALEGSDVRLGPFDEHLAEFDVAIRSPGIPINHPALVAFQSQGGQVVNPSSIWFAERPQVPVIGITGSKGKSTTTAMLGHMLSHLGLQVAIAGNIGRPLVGLLDAPSSETLDWVVAELSSYQLVDLVGQLRLGLITRLFPEHIDWHGGVNEYYGAKARLFELCSPHPVLVNAEDPILISTYAGANHLEAITPRQSRGGIFHEGRWIGQGEAPWFDGASFNFKGQHNLDNAVMALSALDALGLDAQAAAMSLASLEPLAHRLEPVVEREGVVWINDSIATTPHATKAALESLDADQIILLVGGKERGGDWSVLVNRLAEHPLSGLVTLPDNGPAIAESLKNLGVLEATPIEHGTNMQQAVSLAWALAQAASGQGSVAVVLSPGAPSFGHYRDFEDRGQQFVAAIRALSG